MSSANKKKTKYRGKCIRAGDKVIKAVVEKSEVEKENVWKLRHVGIFTFKKGRFRI